MIKVVSTIKWDGTNISEVRSWFETHWPNRPKDWIEKLPDGYLFVMGGKIFYPKGSIIRSTDFPCTL